MNVIERAECLLDSGSSGNMNFTVIAVYCGELDAKTLETGLAALQARHLLLRSSITWQGNTSQFSPTSQPVPVLVQPLLADQLQVWKPAAMSALRQRFDDNGEPLWRVTWLRGDACGQLMLTFHHAVADGLSAMALVQQLFQHLGAGLNAGNATELAGVLEEQAPDLEQSFKTDRYGAFAVRSIPDRQDAGLTTGYVLEELAAEASRALLGWSRERRVRLNATLQAAFLQALVAGGWLPSATTTHTVVNLRGLAQPALSWGLMRLLRVCVDAPIEVDPAAPLDGLARQLHQVLQDQLRDGKPIMALNTITAALGDSPSPQELWRRSWREGGLITNLGRVPVQAHHGVMELVSLFFVANIEPIALPDKPLAVLGALTFRERLMLTCFHIEQQMNENEAMALMADMKRRLLAATRFKPSPTVDPG